MDITAMGITTDITTIMMGFTTPEGELGAMATTAAVVTMADKVAAEAPVSSRAAL